MSKFKKFFAGIATAALVASQALTAVVYGATGLDDPEFDAALAWMYENGLTKYNSVDAFRPFDTLTREQAAKFFSVFAEKVLGATPADVEAEFTDLDSADPTLEAFIVTSFQMGLFKGSNGMFMPKEPLTKAAALTVLVRAMEGVMDEDVDPWWANYFEKARALGLTKETNVYALDRSVTRYEIALMLFRAAGSPGMEGDDDVAGDDDDLGDIIGDLFGDDDDDDAADDDDDVAADDDDVAADDDDVSDVEGAVLEVSLSPDTPRNQFVPGTGSNIKVMKVDLAAGTTDVELRSLTVKLNGLASRNNITAVYMTNAEGLILTNQRAFNSDYEARLVFENKFVIPANRIVSVYLRIDTANSQNEIFTFSIPSTESVDADVDVVGDFPITSFNVQTTAYSSETVNFEGEWTGATAGTNQNIYVGDTNKRVMQFSLTSQNTNKRNVSMKTITFRGSDQLEGVIDNVELVVGGQNIAQDVIIDGKEITFFLDYTIQYGDTKTFYVYADVVGGEKNDVIQLYLNQSSDISGIELETNAAINIQYSTSGGTSLKYGERYVIQEGDNLITKSSETPTSQYIPNDARDILALVANVNISNPMNVDKFRVFITVESGAALGAGDINTVKNSIVERVKLYINDKYIDEDSAPVWDATEGQFMYEFSYYDTLEGTNKVMVKIDTQREAQANNVVKNVTVKNSSFAYGSNAEYVSSRNTVVAGDVKGSAISATMTIKRPALESVTRTDGYAATEKVVKGIENFTVLKMTLQANNVRNLVLNGFTVEAITGDNAGMSNLQVMVGDEVIDTDNFSDGSATFSSLNIEVPKGGTKQVSITLNISSSYTDTQDLQLRVKTFDLEDEKGNSVSDANTLNTVTFDVIGSAVLYAERDNNTPDSTALAANQNTEYEVARFKFKAVNDAAQMQELTLVNVGNNTVTGNLITGGNAAAVVDTSADAIVNTVYLYNTAGEPLGTATLADGYAYFTLSPMVELPRDEDVIIVVKVKANSINDVSLTNTPLRFYALKAGESVGTKQTKIVSKANGDEITGTNVATWNNVSGKVQRFRATAITLANVTAPSTVLSANPDVFGFNIAVDSANSASVKEVRLDLSLTDSTTDGTGFKLTAAGWEVYMGGSKINASNVNVYSLTGTCSLTGGKFTTQPDLTGPDAGGTRNYCVRVVFAGDYVNGYDLTSGTQTQFKLRATAENYADNDRVSTKMNGISDDATTFNYQTSALITGSIVWSDRAADNITLNTADWFTDAFVEVLPLNSWTVSQ